MIIYTLNIYLPNFLFHELDLYSTNSTNIVYFEKEEMIVNNILDTFFIIVIFSRLVLPRDEKMSIGDFSKLLLLNMTSIADILEMTKLLRVLYTHCDDEYINYKNELFNVILFLISLSDILLAVTLTSKLELFHSKRKNKKIQNRSDQTKNKCRLILKDVFHNDIWGILLLLLLRDV